MILLELQKVKNISMPWFHVDGKSSRTLQRGIWHSGGTHPGSRQHHTLLPPWSTYLAVLLYTLSIGTSPLEVPLVWREVHAEGIQVIPFHPHRAPFHAHGKCTMRTQIHSKRTQIHDPFKHTLIHSKRTRLQHSPQQCSYRWP